MSHHPKVSVCIPSYNHARYLPAAIESVLGQTYRDFEVVIVDDGSSDGSLAIAEGYAARYPDRIRVFTHAGHANLGISETVNLAYLNSFGEYWSGLPSDDAFYPDKLESQVALLESHPEVGWVYSYGELTDETLVPIAGASFFGRDLTRAKNPLHRLIQDNLVAGLTVMARRSCMERAGLHEPGLVYSDWEFWLRLLAQCRPAFIARPLTRVRVHSYNTSGRRVELRENLRRVLGVMKSIRAKAEDIGGELASPRCLALLDLQIAYHSFCLGDEDEARRFLHAGFGADPTLGNDPRFFAEWLRERIVEIHHRFPPDSHGAGFISWIALNLPPSAGRNMARRAAAAKLAMEVFGRPVTDPGGLRRVLRCVVADPFWLGNRSLGFVVLSELLGSNMMEQIRRIRSHIGGRTKNPG
jgi:glycosyltransferase involved in cell wall biosynthesis